MKNHLLLLLCGALILLSFCACTSDDQQDPQPQLTLESIGFSGTLPDGRTFGEEGITSQSGYATASSTNDGSYVYLSLSILDPEAGISIVVELPHVKYSDEYILADDPAINDAVQTYYPYQVVKEKLSIGDKFILSSQTNDVSNTFRLLVLDQKKYTGFTTETTLDQAGSYLKVIELVEGTASVPNSGNVKTLEAVFDLDVKLNGYIDNTNQNGRLKGLLRMKYQQ